MRCGFRSGFWQGAAWNEFCQPSKIIDLGDQRLVSLDGRLSWRVSHRSKLLEMLLFDTPHRANSKVWNLS